MILPRISSTSSVRAKVDFYNSSTLVTTCTCSNYLQDFTVSRQGDTSKFFGFGICHQATINLVDIHSEMPSIEKDFTTQILFGEGEEFTTPYPTLYVTEVNKDEKNNTSSVTAYDKLHTTSSILFTDLGINPPYTFRTLAQGIANYLGVQLCVINDNGSFDTLISIVNLDEESKITVREILDDIAECTQTIYYINNENRLTFRRLNYESDGVIDITKDLYYELETKSVKVLNGICHTTPLGDSVVAEKGIEGETQFIRDNPFWVLRDDLTTLLENATNSISPNMLQFKCDWFGDYTLEIGDGLNLYLNDGTYGVGFLLNDTTSFNGTLSEITEWNYTGNSNETAHNPTSLGEKITETTSKVDRVNKKIELLVSEVEGTNERVTSLTMTTDAINLKVQEHETKIDAFEELETGQVIDRLAQVEIEIDNISATVSENNSAVGEIIADNEKINSDIASLVLSDVTLNEKINSNTSKISGVEVDLASVKTTVSNQTTKISKLESEDATIKGDIERNSRAIGQLEVTTQNISATVANNTSNIVTLTNTTNGLSTKTTKNTEDISALNVSIGEISARVSSNTTDINETNDEIAGVKNTLTTTNDKVAAIEASLDGINLTVSNQDKKITTLETTTKSQDSKITSLQTTTTTQGNKISSLESTTATQGSQISELESITQEQGSDLGDLSEIVDENTSNIEVLTETTETHTSQIGALQVTTSNISASVTSQESKITTLESSTHGLRTETTENTTRIGQLEIKDNEIITSVSNVQEITSSSLETFSQELERVENEVSTKVTAEDMLISIKNEIDNGVEKVTTSTGFTFNEQGLTVEKSGKEMKTQITENGMTVYRDSTAVLTANNEGVDAKNLKASTYLVIGTNSRFENYGTNRTACFWIGG